jgi:muramoyltetrapeptide carboxypeptidase LdcA involved in peptidoglycan recycling
MIKPPRLQIGDRVAAISMSWGGPGAFVHRYAAGKRQLEEEFGLTVIETRHALRDPDWLAKNPRARADDLMEAFSDTSIRGIIATTGGDDSIRLVPYVDPAVIRSHPKALLGYSDTTIAHLLCFQAGLISFYGPSIMAGFAENGGMFPYMVDSIRRTLFCSEPVGVIEPHRGGWTVERLEWAKPELQSQKRALNPRMPWRFLQGQALAEGHLIGGCLEVLAWARGTPVWPEARAFEKAILFLETSEEAPPPEFVARELRSYAAMGILSRLSGIMLGRPGGKVAITDFDAYDRAITQVVVEEHGLIDLPIVTCMDFGHTDPMVVLPYGVNARIDSEREEFTIIDAAVTEPPASSPM